MKKLWLPVLMLAFQNSLAQAIQERLERAVQRLEADSQMRHAILAICVTDGKNGKLVYGHQQQMGMSPASCQKIFTSVAAFDLLGHEYRYKTLFGFDGKIENGILLGNLHLTGFGDPTFGSWRWEETKKEFLLNEIVSALKKNRINKIAGKFFLDDSKFSLQPIPDGWIWGDIGNYYGAGCWGINWYENQYDMVLKPGKKIGEPTDLISLDSTIRLEGMINEIKTGEKGSADNGNIYLPPYSILGFTEGTIPGGSDRFTISGALPYPCEYLSSELAIFFSRNDIKVEEGFQCAGGITGNKENSQGDVHIFKTFFSPSLDSINYWFLKKSINLYAESLIKTIAYEKTGLGSTDKGIELVKEFWAQHGIENASINLADGSGLSPQNRVTTDALVKALQYAKTRSWFPSFYKALPAINGMTMKSGSIGGVRSFAGIQTSRDGKEYLFAIIINNYDGSSSGIVRKIWQLLDLLK